MSELELRTLWVLAGLTVVFVLMGLVEFRQHHRRLQAIRIRVHVNGSRGKSSVTRLVAAALREGGLVTCAKTTGTLPRVILPDGRELPVYRPLRANVIEQLRIVKAARASGAEALVVECMALQPHLQWLSEAQLIRATHGIITNVRPDHLDVMGPEEKDVALALAGMTPHRGTLYAADSRFDAIFEMTCRDRKSRYVSLAEPELDAISEADMAGFSYREHPANVALALRLCRDLGIEREVALRGMWKAIPDPGALTEHTLAFFGRRLLFVNGFAANDPVSTEALWRATLDRHQDVETRIAVFNCRADRPERSVQLGKAYASWPPGSRVFLMGTGTYLFARAAVAAGIDASKLSFVEGMRTDEIFEQIVAASGGSAVVCGMGNIADQGLELVRYFSNRSVVSGTQAAPGRSAA